MHTKTARWSVYTGSVHGLIAWIIYAVVEYFFTSIVPWNIKPSHSFTPVHQGFTILLFFIYPLIGLMLGGLSGLIVHAVTSKKRSLNKEQTSILFRLAAVATVILVFDFNLGYVSLFNDYPSINLLPAFGISILLLSVVVFSSKSFLLYQRLSFIINPWTVTIVLFGILPWVPYEPFSHQTMMVKAVASLFYPVTVFLVSFFIYKIAGRRWIDKSTEIQLRSPGRTLAFLVPVFMLIFGIGLFQKQAPLTTSRNSVLSFKDSSSSQPNIILITMDTVRADHLSLYGYERDTTPNLKKLSQEATLYKKSISASDMTLASHASILTGLYARSHGAHHTFETLTPSDDELGGTELWPYSMPLADKFDTLAESLSAKGYSTMAVVANYGYLSDSYGASQGFQYYDYRSLVPFLGHFLGKTRPFYLRQSIHTFFSNFTSPSDYYMVYRRAEDINREVFTLLNKVDKNKERFFMFINYMDAHGPYMPPTPYDKLFPGKDETFSPSKFNTLEEQVMSLKRKITDKERQHLESQYDGGIAYMDFHIGALITRLKEAGLYENTLFIVTSDHGEAFGEKDLMQHGNSVYQNQVYVPLVIKYPGSSKQEVIDTFVSAVDIMPTVLDTLGYEIPENIQGTSLLKPEHWDDRIVISESFSTRKNISWSRRFYRIERAVFSDDMKLISSTSGKHELYNISTDPEENKNLYSKDAAVGVGLKGRLDQWLATVKDESPSETGVGSHNQLDKDALDRLKALGYIQ